jgi:hypothetical protein
MSRKNKPDLMSGEVRVPDGKSGVWEISTFKLSKSFCDLENLRYAFSGHGYLMVHPGTFKRLTRNRRVIMSNTRMEVRTHAGFFVRARGRVLINGLGLGMALHAVLKKKEVEHVTVIEQSADVIKLVAPSFAKEKRATIIEGDAFSHPLAKGERFNVVWHDIWDEISPDNLPGMNALGRKYGRRCDWQGCWAREHIRR